MINLFYEEPDPDRWLRYDRYIRRWIRRIIRGKPKPGGVMMVALSLMKGLDRLGIPYRFNDYAYIRKNPDELIGVIGKPHLIFEKRFQNPILFGAGVFSHPIECPDLFKRYPNVKKMLVPGEWMKDMCAPYYGDQVEAWPVGIDTEKWHPAIKQDLLTVDFLIYDKIRWEHEKYEETLISPLMETCNKKGLRYQVIRYGSYTHPELIEKLSMAKAVLFLCEHETQGLAYQQILATNTPILAWDRGGHWQDPSFYPHKVRYGPVSSVPYWDDRCGMKFSSKEDFEPVLTEFISRREENKFEPRAYILAHLSLEICAQKYTNIYHQLEERQS